MLNHLRVGANDVQQSGRFYAAILVPLGYAYVGYLRDPVGNKLSICASGVERAS